MVFFREFNFSIIVTHVHLHLAYVLMDEFQFLNLIIQNSHAIGYKNQIKKNYCHQT